MMRFTYESDRLVLKVLNETHTPLVLDFLSRNRNLFDFYEVEKPKDFYTESFLTNMLNQEYNQIIKGGLIRYYILEKACPTEIIGTVSFTGFRSAPYHSCHIGYKFDSRYHHQGYAYESVAELLGYVISEYRFHRIEAHIHADNLPSIRLAEKLGFEFEGIARDYAKIRGIWQDHLQYALICR